MIAITYDELLATSMAEDLEFAAEWNRLALAHTVAVALIAYRHKHCLSQRELAQRMGVRSSRVASGETNPKVETLAKIVATTGLEFAIDIAPAGQPKLVRKAVRDRPAHTRAGASLRVGFARHQPDIEVA